MKQCAALALGSALKSETFAGVTESTLSGVGRILFSPAPKGGGLVLKLRMCPPPR